MLVQSTGGFEKGDMAALEKLWANDESVTVFESGHANYGRADYRDHHLGPEMKEMKNTKYTLSDIKVKLSGKQRLGHFQVRHFGGHRNASRRRQRVGYSGIGETRKRLADCSLAFKRAASCSGSTDSEPEANAIVGLTV